MWIKLAYFLTAAVCTLVLLYLLQPIAVRIGLVDRPRDHKLHRGDVPLTGGLAMFGGFWITVILLDVPCPNKLSLAIASSLLVIMGAWDDYRPLSARIRLAVQCTAALVIISGEVIIENLDDIFGLGEIVLERGLAILLTLIAIVGVINAMNMIDGLDGLAGSLVGILFLCLVALTASTNLEDHHLISLILLGIVSSFLVFNFPFSAKKRAKSFMGDAGSMFLGLVVVWSLILLSQKPHNTISPIVALWLFAIPVIDTVNLLLRRLILGSSPLASGRDHLHHILLLMGCNSRRTVSIIIAFACLLSLFGLLGSYMNLSRPLLFYAFVGLFVGYFLVTYHLWFRFNKNDRHNQYKSRASSYWTPPEFSGYSGKPSRTNEHVAVADQALGYPRIMAAAVEEYPPGESGNSETARPDCA